VFAFPQPMRVKDEESLGRHIVMIWSGPWYDAPLIL
jgi:hypothetical protein